MGIDIRLPIGLMFSLFGLLLTAFGLFSERAVIEPRAIVKRSNG